MLILSDKLCAGVDEVGRGCLAGPVVAAAVILPHKFDEQYNIHLEYIKDSKKLSYKKRLEMYYIIKEIAIDYSVAFIDNTIVDRNNIRNATLSAMQTAIDNLNITPEFMYIDGNYYASHNNIEFKCIPQGDSKFMCIAAASIIAKVERDLYVETKMHNEYPLYNWIKNKCYGTKEHYDAIKEYGITKYHRKTFLH